MTSYFMRAVLNGVPTGKVSVIVAESEQAAKRIYGQSAIIIFQYPSDRIYESSQAYAAKIREEQIPPYCAVESGGE